MSRIPGAVGRLGDELSFVLDLAKRAGVEIVNMRTADLAVDLKPGDEPVTAADRWASELIVEALTARFSDPVISEEAPPDPAALAAQRLWFVDPIDGTKDFIRGGDGFAVMIGLVEAGTPVLGVVHQPTVERTFFATPDGGACVDLAGEIRALRVSPVETAADARLVASKNHRSSDIDLVKRQLGIADEENVGSVGVKLCMIALGIRDLYVNPAAKTKAWDTCAPEAILVSAGGRLSDMLGERVRYDQIHQGRGLVASNGLVHDEVIGKLGPLFSPKYAR